MTKTEVALELVLALIEHKASPLTPLSTGKEIADYYNEVLNNLNDKVANG